MITARGMPPPRTRGSVSPYRDPRHARAYDRDRFGGRFGRRLEAGEVRTFRRMLGSVRGPVLDAGAGTGKLAHALASSGLDVVAVDLSEAMLRIARDKRRGEAAAVDCVVSDAERLCFRDRAFGCTVASRLLMHVPGWRRAIAELCRVTRDDLVIDFPATSSFAALESVWRRLIPTGGRGAHRAYRTFSPSRVRDEVEMHGFTVVACRRGYFLPVRVHRRLDRPATSERIEAGFRRVGLTRILGSPVTMHATRPRSARAGDRRR